MRPYFSLTSVQTVSSNPILRYACACLWAMAPVPIIPTFIGASILANEPATMGSSPHEALFCFVRGVCRLYRLGRVQAHAAARRRGRSQWPADQLRQAREDLPHTIPANSRKRQRRSGTVAEARI